MHLDKYGGEVLVNSELETFYLKDDNGFLSEGGIHVIAGCDGDASEEVSLYFGDDYDTNYFVIVDKTVKIEEKLIQLRSELTKASDFPFLRHKFEIKVISW